MTRTLVLFLAAAALFAAGDTWTKVKELKSGTEIRILRRGSTKPVEAKLDEVRDDSVVIVVKNEQKAIPKTEIDRLDYRPQGGGFTKETTAKKDNMPDAVPPAGMAHGPAVPGESYSTTVSHGKPGYETIYRRPVGAKPAPEEK